MKYLILISAFFILLSCSDEQITNPISVSFEESTTGLKSKIVYPSVESDQILSIKDFKHNDNDKVYKTISYGSNREMIYNYELFIYDNSAKLKNKLSYYRNINSETGFILLDSTTYIYSGSFLITEKKVFPYANYFEKYNYEYDGKYLIKKTKYHNDGLVSYVTYEYNNGLLNKEIEHYKDSSFSTYKKYKYKDVVLVETVYYTSENEEMRKISYTYNADGKLSLEEVDVLQSYSSLLPHIVKYIY